MNKQLQYIALMQDDLQRSAKKFLMDVRENRSPYGSKEHGKYVVLSKITALRRELLNLHKRIKEEGL